MALNLGFSSDPIISTDVKNGEIMIWNGDKDSLMITLNTNSVQLSSNSAARVLIQNATNKNLSESDYQSLAQQFLSDKIGLGLSKLSFTGTTYFKTQDGVEYLASTTKDEAEITQLNYSLSSSNYPILTSNPDSPQISIQFLKDGSILSFNGNIGSSYQNSPNTYPLINYFDKRPASKRNCQA